MSSRQRDGLSRVEDHQGASVVIALATGNEVIQIEEAPVVDDKDLVAGGIKAWHGGLGQELKVTPRKGNPSPKDDACVEVEVE